MIKLVNESVTALSLLQIIIFTLPLLYISLNYFRIPTLKKDVLGVVLKEKTDKIEYIVPVVAESHRFKHPGFRHH